jgi:hypothetical protein
MFILSYIALHLSHLAAEWYKLVIQCPVMEIRRRLSSGTRDEPSDHIELVLAVVLCDQISGSDSPSKLPRSELMAAVLSRRL